MNYNPEITSFAKRQGHANSPVGHMLDELLWYVPRVDDSEEDHITLNRFSVDFDSADFAELLTYFNGNLMVLLERLGHLPQSNNSTGSKQ